MSPTDPNPYENAFAPERTADVFDTIPELIEHVVGLMQDTSNCYAQDQKLDADPLYLKYTSEFTKDKQWAQRLTAGPGTWWFRGVSSDKYDLTSKLFRIDHRRALYTTQCENNARLDQKLHHEYALLTRRQFEEAVCNVWDRTFEMQEYGMPTRLLDWTSHLITAIFFAVYSAITKRRRAEEFISKFVPAGTSTQHTVESETEPCMKSIVKELPAMGNPTVWMLNPRILAGVSLGAYALDDFAYIEMNGSWDEFKTTAECLHLRQEDTRFGSPNWIYQKLVETPGHFPLLASYTNPRLLAQSGCFTLQGGRDASTSHSLNVMAGEHTECCKPRYLAKFSLSEQNLDSIWRQLQFIGVDKYYLFPEKEQTAESIVERRLSSAPK